MIKVSLQCQKDTTAFLLPLLTEHQISVIPHPQNALVHIVEISHQEDLLKLSEIRKSTDIICIIEDGTWLFDLIDLKPLGFIKKAQMTKETDWLLKLITQKKNGPDTMVHFQSGTISLQLPVSEIIYIESLGHNLFIHTVSAEYKIRDSLINALEKLTDLEFMQIHKSYIINKKCITSRSSAFYTLNHHIQLPIGRKYRYKNPDHH